jgi:hypothetical protein
MFGEKTANSRVVRGGFLKSREGVKVKNVDFGRKFDCIVFLD